MTRVDHLGFGHCGSTDPSEWDLPPSPTIPKEVRRKSTNATKCHRLGAEIHPILSDRGVRVTAPTLDANVKKEGLKVTLAGIALRHEPAEY